MFGLSHIYQSPTCLEIYQSTAYDPEGLLGNLTSIALCYFGVQVCYAFDFFYDSMLISFQLGRTLTTYKAHKQRLLRWVAWGIFLAAIATILAKASQNDGWIPINKNLWSVSFVLAMGGTGYLVFSLLYVAIDIAKIWSGIPFVSQSSTYTHSTFSSPLLFCLIIMIFPGMNSIVVYMGSEILGSYIGFKAYAYFS